MAIEVNDILIDSNYELIFKDGDLFIDKSDKQHCSFVIKSAKGEWKESALLGVEINKYLNSNSSNYSALETNIREQLTSDNYTVQDLKLNGNIDIKLTAQRLK